MQAQALRRTQISLLVMGLVPLAVLIFLLQQNVSSAEPALVNAEPPVEPPTVAGATIEQVGVPVRIKIPSLALDAAIEPVALTAEQQMAVPQDPLNAGWYKLGPRPGEVGSAVIDGHVAWLDGATAVFSDLHLVEVGDTVTTQDEFGKEVTFAVSKISIYDPAADATEIFISTDGQAHLNLITCDGVWDSAAQQYPKRLVVFTDRIEE